MSSEMIEAPVVEDVGESLHLIARTPNEMREAQSALSQWFAAKLAIIAKDVADLDANLQIAVKNGWKRDGFERALNREVSRHRFYEKCKAAVDAGYCIVPNFPVDVFAVRTCKYKPPRRNESTWHGTAQQEQSSESPALGLGDYRDSEPITGRRTEYVEDRKTGLTNPVSKFFAKAWQDEIDFPICVARPEIMSRTAEAMALKCFDELGVLPNTRRSKGDPILVGIIRDRSNANRTLSFLIAWYIDTATL